MRRIAHRLSSPLSLIAFAVAAVCLSAAAPEAQAQAGAAAKTIITRAEQLPRRSYELPRLPSELLEAPLAQLLPLANAIERDIAADLAAFEIQDQATLRGLQAARMSIAMLRGDNAAVLRLAAGLREMQDKPGPRLTSGVLLELLLQARAAGADTAAQSTRLQTLVAERYGAMPWADVQDTLKGLKAQMETASRELVIGSFRSQLDTVARNAEMKVPAGVVLGVLGARMQLDQVFPLRAAVVAGLSGVIDRNVAAAPVRADIWSERLVNLPANSKATPVAVAVWDSGVDLNLFKTAPGRGLAFGDDGRPSADLLRPLGAAQSRWPQLRGLTKGALDLRAALDTDDARRLKQTIAGLKADDVKAFQEDLGLASLYTHGTHVAGIAVEGNPFASVYAVTMLWSHQSEPARPSEERSRRAAANYTTIAAGLKAAGVRVVNMSWRYGPSFYEAALTYHGMGRDAEERKRTAQSLFAIERDALKAAITSVPEILFVAGSGNEDNSADFVEYIPAGFELPNLITVGAVDKSGDETNFSTFGKTVVVHANGYEVDSLIPGGDRMKFSGTSMAAPQVSNLAAKLIALDPALTPVQVKAMILAHAEKRGRVNLINPKATIAALGVKVAQRP